jgi:cell division protein FtsA
VAEGVLVALDVGTEQGVRAHRRDRSRRALTVIGHGTVPSSGLKRGAVVNIEQTVRSIRDAVERAERLSGWKIDKAFVGVGGAQVESFNSTGQVSVSSASKEISRDDIRRAVEQARTIPIPSNREVLHVERRGFTVDGQEGVKDPLGHERPAPRGRGPHRHRARRRGAEPDEVRRPGGREDRRARRQRARLAEAVANETEKELGVAVADVGAGTIDLAMFNEGSPFRTSVLPVGGNFVTNDIAIGIKTSLPGGEELKVSTARATCAASRTTRRSRSRSWATRRAERSAAPSCAGSSSRACARRSSSSAPRSRRAARACSRPG